MRSCVISLKQLLHGKLDLELSSMDIGPCPAFASAALDLLLCPSLFTKGGSIYFALSSKSP